MIQPTISLEMPVSSQGHYGFHSFPVVDWLCLFIYLKSEDVGIFYTFNGTKAAYSKGVIRTLKTVMYSYFTHNQTYKYDDKLQDFVNKGNNKITELRTILQRESHPPWSARNHFGFLPLENICLNPAMTDFDDMIC
jgi:hypothetical protein